MKAMRIEGDWGLENLKQVDLPDPEPGPGEVVIGMDAVSINPRDLILAGGGYGRVGGTPPLIPLCDGAGKITAIGDGVENFAVGDLVCPTYSRLWMRGLASPDAYKGAHGGPLDGTAQEMMLIPANAVVRTPRHMSAEEAATLPCAAITAWNALAEQGDVKPGDKVLVQGTGGVSLFALQFAKAMGAEVYLISSSDEKLERAKAMGADHLLNYRDVPDWHKSILKMTDGKGVDHVVEVGGSGTLEKSTAVVRYSGTISMIGVLGGASGEFGLGRVVTRNLRLQGVTCGSKEMFENMVRALELHQIRPAIDPAAEFQLKDLAKALKSLPEGKHFGKIVGIV
ncbi:NAD(P)-dependent alcohol dehydrogenase [Hwanghaeella grinnelliae]|uniref:NAD(P)-dependent alcohol dehydrogenase n=1 Tax=Hwanghaeella grinnelliae TaxID=2500179 RepID=A0A3S2W979_9PROT|nr:NAD(P)-dependent alcohol dehydrogenase [Hwanghaeella grinnelliae]RVU36345.1 NAD(P)-dependent alcohol dehydrogenase [Hwanghaeella grinnelliae]